MFERKEAAQALDLERVLQTVMVSGEPESGRACRRVGDGRAREPNLTSPELSSSGSHSRNQQFAFRWESN